MPQSSCPNSFLALQPRWLRGDILYRVWVDHRMMAGGFLAGQVHDGRTARVYLQQLNLLLGRWVRRCIDRRAARERDLESIDPFQPTFLNENSRNFQIARLDVRSVRLRRNRSHWNSWNRGTLRIETVSGRRLTLLLHDDRSQDEVIKLLHSLEPSIEVTGHSSPDRTIQPRTPRQQRRALNVIGAILIAVGGFFATVNLWGVVRISNLWLPVIVNVLLGLYFLRRARSIKIDGASTSPSDIA